MLLKSQIGSLQACTAPNLSTFIDVAKDSKKHESSDQPDVLDCSHRKRVRKSSDTYDFTTKHRENSPLSIIPSFLGCGLCAPESGCICQTPLELHSKDIGFSFEFPKDANTVGMSPIEGNNDFEEPNSILDRLPKFQPAVPLRSRPTAKRGDRILFRVHAVSPDAKCSGDPANCAACADDPFGQAFCAAFDDAVGSFKSCGGCPGKDVGESNLSMIADASGQVETAPIMHSTIADVNSNDVVSRDVAWKRLKSHPNAPFADLRLLAEVVAKNSSCQGPVLGFSHAESSKVKHADETMQGDGSTEVRGDSDSEVHHHPSLVPQEILIECGRKRLVNIREGGIQEALRLLDARLI